VPKYLLEVPQTKVSLLSNGIRVATEEWPGELATVGVCIGAGSVFENDKNNGVAHFLEHMAFKGTKTRTQHQLEAEIENMGATLNAFTSRENTVYFAKSFKKDVNKSLDILSDIIQNSTFEKEAIERERSTILREIKETENNAEEAIFDYLHSAAYQGTSLGRTILGPVHNVKSITRNDLLEYINTYYTPPHMVIAAAGGVKHEEVVAQAEKLFSKIPAGTSHANIREVHTDFVGSEIRIRNDDHPTAHIAIAVEGVGWTHPDHFTMLVLQTLVGAWDKTIGGGANLSSRLCEIVASEQLVHSFSTFFTCYGNTALFGNTIVADPHNVEDSVYEVLNEWQRLANSASAAEVERAKNKLKATLLLNVEGVTGIFQHMATQMLSVGRVLSPAEIYLRINDVQVADIKRVAKACLSDVSPAVVAIGPIKQFPDYNQLRGWTYWNRM
jgi:processing peptidase subunit beta